jgi:hypothetical protein
MTPAEFIESLLRHYGKRLDSPEKQALWLKEMVQSVAGTDPRLLRRAFELIRDEYEERAFPLPATLKKFIGRASELVYPESATNRGLNSIDRPARKAHIAPQMQAIYESAAVWQKQTMDQYGSWANHWRATRHLRKDWQGSKFAPLPLQPPASMPFAKVRRVKISKPETSVDRIVFEAIHNRSRNTHMHRENSALARMITGERE